MLIIISNTAIVNVYEVFKGVPGASVQRIQLPMQLILGLGRSPGEGNVNPFQYSRLGNPMDRGAWWTIVHGVAKESNRNE